MHVITGLGNGGAEKILYEVIKHTPEICHVVVSLGGLDFYGKKLQDLGAKVYTLNMKNNFLNVFKLFGVLRKNKPDIVQCWMHFANLAGGVCAKLVGVNNIIWSIYWSTLHGFKNQIIEKINAKLSYFIPSKILCCAESSKAARLNAGYSAQKLFVVFNGYDATEFTTNIEAGYKLRNQYKIDPNYFVAGFIARVHPQKDHLNLLRAMTQLKHLPVKLLLVGNYTDSDLTLKDFIKRSSLEDHVILCGFQKNLNDYISMFDIFVLSSKAEGFPNVINESMLCETPCVVTDVGDCAYIVGETGIVVPAKDPTALANAILAMSSLDRAQLKQLGIKARARIKEHFSLEKMIQGYQQMYLDLMQQKVVK